MKLSDNMTILITVLLNTLKDIIIVCIFAYLCYYFNNIWIILFAAIFIGRGYNLKINSKTKGEKKDE